MADDVPAAGGGGLLAAVDRWAQPFEDTANFIAAVAIFLLMLLGTSQVVLRSVFGSPIAGYIDMVELSMATMAFLGAAYSQRLGAHIRMEILVGSLRGRVLWGFEIFGTLVALFIIGVLIWYGWDHFLRSWQLGDSTIDAEYPVWPSKLLVPIAFALWFVRLSIQLAGSVRLFLDPALEPVGIARIQHAAEVAREEIKEALGTEAPDVPVPVGVSPSGGSTGGGPVNVDAARSDDTGSERP